MTKRLVCLLAVLTGVEGVTRSWTWAALIGVGLSGALVVKGVFVVPVLMAAGLWVLVNPSEGSRTRQIAGVAVGLALMAMAAYAYDAAYLRVTGRRFWIAYWTRQLGPMSVDSPFDQVEAFAKHLGFYILRLAFTPRPGRAVRAWRTAVFDRTTERRGLASC